MAARNLFEETQDKPKTIQMFPPSNQTHTSMCYMYGLLYMNMNIHLG